MTCAECATAIGGGLELPRVQDGVVLTGGIVLTGISTRACFDRDIVLAGCDGCVVLAVVLF